MPSAPPHLAQQQRVAQQQVGLHLEGILQQLLQQLLQHTSQQQVGLHLEGLLQADDCQGRGRLVDYAAQGQPDRLRERRGQPRPR